jgi:hypothetical protein
MIEEMQLVPTRERHIKEVRSEHASANNRKGFRLWEDPDGTGHLLLNHTEIESFNTDKVHLWHAHQEMIPDDTTNGIIRLKNKKGKIVGDIGYDEISDSIQITTIPGNSRARKPGIQLNSHKIQIISDDTLELKVPKIDLHKGIIANVSDITSSGKSIVNPPILTDADHNRLVGSLDGETGKYGFIPNVHLESKANDHQTFIIGKDHDPVVYMYHHHEEGPVIGIGNAAAYTKAEHDPTDFGIVMRKVYDNNAEHLLDPTTWRYELWIDKVKVDPHARRLPEYTAENHGWVLAVNDDGTGVTWTNESEIPRYDTAEGGWVLAVKPDKSGIEWKEESELPKYDSSTDKGYILAVKPDGSGLQWEKEAGLPKYTESSKGNVLMVSDDGKKTQWKHGAVPEPAHDGTAAGLVLRATNDGTWNWGQPLPKPTAAGYVLTATGIDTGAWAWKVIPSNGGGNVPEPTANDTRKVLTAIGANSYNWEPTSENLPSHAGKLGKVLGVTQKVDLVTGEYLEDEELELNWVDKGGLPPYASAHVKQVLTVVQNGNAVDLAWQDWYPPVDTITEPSVLKVTKNGNEHVIGWHKDFSIPSYDGAEIHSGSILAVTGLENSEGVVHKSMEWNDYILVYPNETTLEIGSMHHAGDLTALRIESKTKDHSDILSIVAMDEKDHDGDDSLLSHAIISMGNRKILRPDKDKDGNNLYYNDESLRILSYPNKLTIMMGQYVPDATLAHQDEARIINIVPYDTGDKHFKYSDILYAGLMNTTVTNGNILSLRFLNYENGSGFVVDKGNDSVSLYIGPKNQNVGHIEFNVKDAEYSGKTSFTRGDVSMERKLTVTDRVTAKDGLDVSSGNLVVDRGNVEISNGRLISRDAQIDQIDAAGIQVGDAGLECTGYAEFNTVIVDSTCDVYGSAVIQGNLHIQGEIICEGNITTHSTFHGGNGVKTDSTHVSTSWTKDSMSLQGATVFSQSFNSICMFGFTWNPFSKRIAEFRTKLVDGLKAQIGNMMNTAPTPTVAALGPLGGNLLEMTAAPPVAEAVDVAAMAEEGYPFATNAWEMLPNLPV